MKIRNLAIANFKAIDQIDLQDLQDVVVIAGPNGCGKSTIFDAIRFWKTTIGTYQRDEMRQWLSELGLSEQREALLYAHQHKDEPFSIQATIKISDEERAFLDEKGESLLAFYYFKLSSTAAPMAPPVWTMQNLDLIEDFRNKKSSILSQVSSTIGQIRNISSDNLLTGTVEVSIDGTISIGAPLALQVMLSVFVPETMGIIDYYGPQRTFARETVNSLSLEVDQQRAVNRIGSALYNQSQKYSNVKSELASSYIKRLIMNIAGQHSDFKDNLEHSISELFNLFIPGKIFEGIQPTTEGNLTFNVRTSVGIHDIGDLSSGEKELIYGYLRLKSSGLANSVILIDEPELHLNPRLTDGLPDFYYRHIGKPSDNQLWLVTHSDNILRQSVDIDGFNVFHMQTVGTYDDDAPQMIEVSARDDLDRAIIDLVGDLAAYRPGGKLVILEGGGDTDFDLELVTRLFPEFAQRVNLVSSGSKRRVRALHDVLERVGKEKDLFSGVYSVVDSDGGQEADSPEDHRYQWESYQFENYLLVPHFILQVLEDNFVQPPNASENDVLVLLKEAAESTKHTLVKHEIEQFARSTLMRELKLHTPHDKIFDPAEVGALVQGSLDRMLNQSKLLLNGDTLTQKAEEISARLDASLEGNDWLSEFRGRDLLRALAKRINNPALSYEALRNGILAKMRYAQYQPIGIGRVLSRIEPSLLTTT